MTTIILNEVTRLVKTDGYSWQVEYFKVGEGLVRNPANGEMIEQKDKWVTDDSYYSSPRSAVKRAAELECLKKEEYASLREYCNTHEETTKSWLRLIP